MKLATAFRLSTGLCLCLAIACLGYAELGHLDPVGVGTFYVCVGVLILVAYILEGRWVLPVVAANLLGLAIFLGWFVWFYQGLHATGRFEEAALDMKGWILPRIGPLLTILLLAKFLRPKHHGDYWLLQGLALVQVALACILAAATSATDNRQGQREPLFPILLLGYVVTGIWSMLLFYFQREDALCITRRRAQPAAPAEPARLPWFLLGLRQTGVWALLGIAFGVILFLVVPWPGKDQTSPVLGKPQSQTGFTPGMNLNHTGKLKISREPIMRVSARDANNRPVSLPPEPRWRGVACSHYQAGKWTVQAAASPKIFQPPEWRGIPREDAMVLVIDILDLSRIASDASSVTDGTPLFLLEPVHCERMNLDRATWTAAVRPPVNAGRMYWYASELTLRSRQADGQFQYAQLARHTGQTRVDWTGPLPTELVPKDAELDLLKGVPNSISSLFAQDTAGILRDNNALDADAESKARTLERHLRRNFRYSFTRRRVDRNLDPTEDFVRNVREGHCELFASALALMLRTQGIPARVVIGYRGANWEPGKGAGVCEVTQEHAHAWVEVLIQRADGLHYWLALDGTPGVEAVAAAAAASEAEDSGGSDEYARRFWNYLLDYNGDVQQSDILGKLGLPRLGEALRSGPGGLPDLGSPGGIALVVAAALAAGAVIFLLRRFWRRRTSPAERITTRVPFYRRLLALLSRLRLRPRPSQTPLEFGDEVVAALGRGPQTSEVAGVPPEVVAAFYDVRYGGRELSADEANALNTELDRLEAALAGTSGDISSRETS